MENTKYTEMEMQIRQSVQDEGELRHPPAESKDQRGLDDGVEDGTAVLEIGTETNLGRGSREKTVLLDMGNGPEDVVLIDWAEGDPEVRSHDLLP
jgi:hypothetical protein